MYLCTHLCVDMPSSWTNEWNSYIQGRTPVLPFMESSEGKLNGASRAVNMAGGWIQGGERPQRKCFPGLEPLKKEESISRLRSGFCLVEIWEFHHVHVLKQKICPWYKLQEFCLWIMDFILRFLCTVLNQQVYLCWRSFPSIIDD